MGTLNDCRFESLRAQGFTGATNDMLLEWALANGGITPTLNDALLEMLLANGAITPTLNDAWYEFLIALGFVGARNDMETEFWCGGGSIGPPLAVPIAGVYGGNLGCLVTDALQVQIEFDLPVLWTFPDSGVIVSGLEIRVDGVPDIITSVTDPGAGSTVMQLLITTPSTAVNVATANYDGTGIIDVASGEPIKAFNGGLFNCASGSGFGPGFGPGFD